MNFFNDYGQEPLGCTHPVPDGGSCSHCPKPGEIRGLWQFNSSPKDAKAVIRSKKVDDPWCDDCRGYTHSLDCPSRKQDQ